jgi:CheY-like chemotaxis protein
MKNTPTVLLVDDDVDTREMYAWSLELRGFRVLAAGSVTQAAALAAAQRPDAIVTDFTLPGEDGFKLAERIRASAALNEIPLVLVSGRAFVAGTGDRALELFDGVLLKPVLPDQLIAEIVPLMLNRAAATLQRQLGDVRQRIARIPTGSAVGRVLSAVDELSGQGAPAALLADSDARYIGVNDAACALTGRSRQELLSLNVWDLTPAIAVDRGRVQWAQFVSSGSLTGAYRITGPSGVPINASFAAFAHILPDCHLSLLSPVPPALIQD